MARWTSEQELDAALAMRAAEAEALELICDLAVAKPILAERNKRSELTNSAAIDRLVRAVHVSFEAHKKGHSKKLKDRVHQAMRLLGVASDWRWRLAMSAEYVAKAESYKRALSEEDQRELAQVGVIGLMDAAKRFDPARLLRFTTYARWWVIARMTRHANPYPVKASPNFLEKRTKVNKAIQKLEKQGIDWSVEELSEHAGLTLNQTRRVLKHPLQGVSLSTPSFNSTEGNQRLLVDDMVDETTIDPTEHLHKERRERWLAQSVAALSPRQRFVLTRRYGLGDGQWRTLAEVGIEMSLSRERVRQIESEALIHLRTLRPPIDPAKEDHKPQRPRPISEEAIFAVLKPGTPLSKTAITQKLFKSESPEEKDQVLKALRRLKKQGIVHRTGHGLASRWHRIVTVLPPPEPTAPWRPRIEFDLTHHPWSNSREIADRLGERDRLNSLSATLGILWQSRILVRKPDGRSWRYAMPKPLILVKPPQATQQQNAAAA